MNENPSIFTCTVSKTFDVSHLVMAVVPPKELTGEPLVKQLEAVNEQIGHLIAENVPGARVIQQTVFLKNYEDRHFCQEFWRNFYGEDLPVNVYVPQPPCDGQLLAVEVIAEEDAAQTRITRQGETLTILKHSGITWYYACQQEPKDYSQTMYAQSVGMFQQLDRTFGTRDIPFENVIRTWLYLGNITEPTFSELEGETQRYKELNRARTDFFRDIRFFDGVSSVPWTRAVYPASTGIGGQGDTVVMSALAVSFDDPAAGAIVPLENPQQTSAFDYSQEYSIKSPKFARALLLAGPRNGAIFVSGTASITDQETRYPDDPEKQTELTLENIALLISEENLKAHGKPGFGCRLDEMVCARVYVKRMEDYETIRKVCERLIPNVPKIFTIADVCRPDLLVEIEGMADVGPAKNITRK